VNYGSNPLYGGGGAVSSVGVTVNLWSTDVFVEIKITVHLRPLATGTNLIVLDAAKKPP
jgi:hypothetical protein